MNSRLLLVVCACVYPLLPASAEAAQITIGTPVVTTNNSWVVFSSDGVFVDSDRGTEVPMSWDGTAFTSSSDYSGPGSVSNMTLSTSRNFGGKLISTFHDVQVFAPGTYNFDTSLGGGEPETELLTMTVGPDQWGAHMLLDLGASVTPLYTNIDVAVVWDKNALFDLPGETNDSGPWDLASVDGNGDGLPGIPMVAGGFLPGFTWTFNLNGPVHVVPLPAAVWLFGSGLLGIVGVARRKKRI